MDILLYGLGSGLFECENAVKKDINIIGYTDSFSDINIFMGKPFFSYKDIPLVKFDYIIITVKENVQNIKENLIKDYQIEEHKIISYFSIINHEIWKNKMVTYCLKDREIMIFGNSHAAYGLLEKYFSVPTLNLAVPSQDIYHSYLTFCECIKNYGERFKNLKVIVIDLYDYEIFNIDVTKLDVYANYLQCGGYISKYDPGGCIAIC